MKRRIKQVDRRFKGYHDWKYYVDLVKSPIATEEHFYNIQVWCWETWGPSKEISFWNEARDKGWKDKTQNSKWCWHLDEWTARIYLKSDKEADWFSLKYA
jgi:hypothetical protein